MKYLHLVMLGAALAGPLSCASRPAPAAVDAPRLVPPDLHGEALALVPEGSLGWVRLDLATLRRSPHFDGTLEAARSLGADLAMVQRELGHDVFRQGELAVLAIFPPPGRGQAGWPLAVVRGALDREAIVAEARARLPNAAPTEAEEEGYRFTVIGQRAYLFAAPDVMLMMERGLVRRVAARLRGRDPQSAQDEGTFRALLARAEGADKPARFVLNLEAIRGLQSLSVRNAPQVDAINQLAGWAELPDASHIHAVGLTSTARAAREVADIVTRESQRMGGLLPVRLLGLSRLLNQGVRARAEGELVTLDVDATRDESRRAMRIATILDDLTGEAD